MAFEPVFLNTSSGSFILAAGGVGRLPKAESNLLVISFRPPDIADETDKPADLRELAAADTPLAIEDEVPDTNELKDEDVEVCVAEVVFVYVLAIRRTRPKYQLMLFIGPIINENI